jgi:hypothetical protein
MSVGIGRQNIKNSVFEIKRLHVSFLGIHKWEPDLYIGFSLALHLQCLICVSVRDLQKIGIDLLGTILLRV